MTSIPVPNLDDRDFEQLRRDALAFAASRGSEWTDLGPGDPGVVLLESFAYLTDVLLFRLNRVPEKARGEFLRLLGLGVMPPGAAHVVVELRRGEGDDVLTVPGGTRVTAGTGQDAVEFLIADSVQLGAGPSTTNVVAHHVDQVGPEVLGISTGEPGQTFRLSHTPVVRPTGHELDLFIGVELDATLADRPDARVADGRAFERWEVVETFAGVRPDARVCRVDRSSGLVTFAPAVRQADGGVAPMGSVPPARRQVCAWYRVGGGSGGNVASGALTRLEPAVGGVEVTNPLRAVGGADPETLEDALRRASEVFHEPRRAVTADDFVALARRIGGVARAVATTEAEAWVHATPGSVELRLVPAVGTDAPPTAAELREAQQEGLLRRVAQEIADRQPLGVRSSVRWCRYKPVAIHVTITVAPTEDPTAVRDRVATSLRHAISPTPRPDGTEGWPFGRSLTALTVYDIARLEPGIRNVDAVGFEVLETPDGRVGALAADRFQLRTWYAGDATALYRSQNDAVGWERLHLFDGGAITRIVPADDRAGAVAVIVAGADGHSSQLHVSLDCGETLQGPVASFSWTGEDAPQVIQDVAWLPEGGTDDLLLATDRGLYRLRIGDPPRSWVVDPGAPNRGCWAVAAAPTPDGTVEVLVAQQEKGDVWRVLDGGDVFTGQGLGHADVRRLVIERRGLRLFVWAPTFAVGTDEGLGCYRGELRTDVDSVISWVHLGLGWNGGICHDLAFLGERVLAASQFNGVLVRDTVDPDEPWRSPSVEDSQLPLTETRQFQPATSVDASGLVALTGTHRGVFRTTDGAVFELAARRAEPDSVTLPDGWLFVSGEHEVEVRVEQGRGRPVGEG